MAEGLRQLERGGFLDRDQKNDLYTFHQTLRDHAEQGTGLPAEQSSAAFLGLLHYYAGFLRDNSGNYGAIDRCLANALATMETAWAARREPGPLDATLAAMVDDLGYIFDRRGLWQLGDRWHERAITLRRGSKSAHDEKALAHELYRRAGLLKNRGQPAEAARLYRESLQIDEKAGDLRGQAASLHVLAIIESDQGNPAEARRLLQRSLGLKEGLGDLQGQAASLTAGSHRVRRRGTRRRRGGCCSVRSACWRAWATCGQSGLAAPAGGSSSRRRGTCRTARRLLQSSLGLDEGLGDMQGQAALAARELAVIESSQGNPL